MEMVQEAEGIDGLTAEGAFSPELLSARLEALRQLSIDDVRAVLSTFAFTLHPDRDHSHIVCVSGAAPGT